MSLGFPRGRRRKCPEAAGPASGTGLALAQGMRTLLVLSAASLLALACGAAAQQQPLSAQERSAPAVLHNDLPADGCTWVVEVEGERYAPDAASARRIRDFTGGAIGATEAALTYRLPGGTTEVPCGWGAHQELPTIEVLTLRAP